MGRPQVKVSGFGFDAVRSGVGLFQEPLTPANGTFNYTLRFSAGSFSASTPAVALTDGTLVAYQPLWRFPPLLTEIEVLHDGNAVPKVTFTTPEEATDTQGVNTGEDEQEEEVDFDYKLRGKIASGDIYSVESGATAPYTISCTCSGGEEGQTALAALHGQPSRR